MIVLSHRDDIPLITRMREEWTDHVVMVKTQGSDPGNCVAVSHMCMKKALHGSLRYYLGVKLLALHLPELWDSDTVVCSTILI